MAASLAVEWAKKGVRVNCLRCVPFPFPLPLATRERVAPRAPARDVIGAGEGSVVLASRLPDAASDQEPEGSSW